jgi:hypothetical protein
LSPSPSCRAVVGPTSVALRSGDLFRFRFAVPSGAADADVLVTFMGEGGSLSESALTVRVYDGTSLLGAVDEYQDTVAFWKSPASSSPLTPAVVIDFRKIADGTVDGRVEFSVTRGSPHVDRLDLATVTLLDPSNLNSVGTPVISGRELCR